MTSRHDNVVLISSLGSRENIVGVSDFISRVDKQTALNRSRLNSSEQDSSVSPGDSCSGNIGAFGAGEVRESSTANQTGEIIIYDSSDSSSSTCAGNLQTELAVPTRDQCDLPRKFSGVVTLFLMVSARIITTRNPLTYLVTPKIGYLNQLGRYSRSSG